MLSTIGFCLQPLTNTHIYNIIMCNKFCTMQTFLHSHTPKTKDKRHLLILHLISLPTTLPHLLPFKIHFKPENRNKDNRCFELKCLYFCLARSLQPRRRCWERRGSWKKPGRNWLRSDSSSTSSCPASYERTATNGSNRPPPLLLLQARFEAVWRAHLFVCVRICFLFCNGTLEQVGSLWRT